MSRIEQKFANLKQQNRKALITFVSACDPSYEISLNILKQLPKDGADLIEIGMPFTDPMADGPAIQLASQRALKAGGSVRKCLSLVSEFRQNDTTTPIVLMGYYNPIMSYGQAEFIKDALQAGVDGLIIVDLPPEEDQELCIDASKAGLDFIRLTTPTTDETRLKTVLKNASGFIYYVSITGVTGTATADVAAVKNSILKIKSSTELPVVAGFGIKSAQDVASFSEFSDGVVVGSAIVAQIEENIDNKEKIETSVSDFVQELAKGLS